MPALLQFVDVSSNISGWTTYAYAAELPEKPAIMVMPDSGGSVWIGTGKIKNGNPKLLKGHLGITRRALAKIGA